ncbi:MAG: hypothetical protein GX178_04440 [Acidobacteria bacterium]|nr:hypothetical protein [Thermoanaerobaculia bacterium]MBP7812272.1 hypothetical protein [Thermoanaerobaculia bacterium]MBP8845566.1 hypothetical protein [Thermoanaerobaculia bacterium]NLN10843.1 hypothetical protein [Acidobacteriota bacterium]HRR14866.1 hypothetical protein [Thermoanaerobaculia bacterium]
MTAALLLAALLATQAPTVRVELDPAAITVGDPVTALVVVEGTAAEPVIGPWSTSWGEAEIAETGPVEPAGSGRWQQRLRLTAFRTGELTLPPPEIVADGVALTAEPVILTIRSVLPPDEENPAPRPPAPPVPLPTPAAFWWLLAALTAFTLAGVALLAERERQRRREVRPRPAVPPLAELLAALAPLGGGASEAGHTALSLALRRYLGRRLDFPAAESSTSEIGRWLATQRLGRDLARTTVQLLRDCDQVKFARRPATAAELASRLVLAQEVAGEIEASLQPPAEPAAPQEAA